MPPDMPPSAAFLERAQETEWMDAPCTYQVFRDVLRGLRQVNLVTFGYRPTLAWLNRLRLQPGDPVHIVDVGCGGGDMLIQIRHWARRRNLSVSLTGIDLNPYAARAARELYPRQQQEIRWVTGDAFSYTPPEPIDIVISSLFAHHLPDAELIRFLGWMERVTTRGWFINDLHREPQPYRLFRFVSRLLRWHRFIQHDGPLSILRSFQPEDWRGYLSAAGLDPAAVHIETFKPGRLCVGRRK